MNVIMPVAVPSQTEIEALERDLAAVVAEQEKAMEEFSKKIEKLKENRRVVNDAHKVVQR